MSRCKLKNIKRQAWRRAAAYALSLALAASAAAPVYAEAKDAGSENSMSTVYITAATAGTAAGIIAPAAKLKAEVVEFPELAEKVRTGSAAIRAIRRSERALKDSDPLEEINAQIALCKNIKAVYGAEYQTLADAAAEYREKAASDSSNVSLWNAAAAAAGSQQAGAGVLSSAFGQAESALEAAKALTEQSYKSQIRAAETENDKAENAIIKAAESCYLQVLSLREDQGMLERAEKSAQRRLSAAEVMAKHGLISAYSVSQIRLAADALNIQKVSIENAVEGLELQLAVMCGMEKDCLCVPGKTPAVPADGLEAMSYEADLKTAVEKNYDRAIAEEKHYFAEAYGSSLDEEAAQAALQAAGRNAESSFRSLYLAVSEKALAADNSGKDADQQKKLLEADRIRLKHGLISNNAYLDAEDELAGKEAALEKALISFYGAYNDYLWALRGLI